MKSIYDDGSWAVQYSEQDGALSIKVLDYHAGPLKLKLGDLLKLMDTTAQSTGASGKQSPPKENKPNDGGSATRDEEPLVGINRKEKSLYIAVPEGWAGVLKISRKELYQFGKKMGRRGKGRKQS